MNSELHSPPKPWWRRRRAWFALLALLVAATLVAARQFVAISPSSDLPLYEVREGPLSISVKGAGTVQSLRNQIVRSQVGGRNTVIWIIDEGKQVTNGQLLVELDSSDFEDRLTDQQILVANANAALTQAKEKLEIALIEQRSSVAEAELKLHLSKLELEKYNQGEYPQQLQEAESKIALSREEAERSTENLNWSRRLAEEGYLTRSELQADELALKQKLTSEAAAVTALNVLTNFTARQQQATLDSNLQQAEMALERITRQMRANVIQAESDLRAKQLEADRQRSRLETYEEYVQNCKISAPTNGVAIYASTVQASRRRWGAQPLEAGATVVERQELIYIPIEGGMRVEVSVPESNLPKLELGQKALIKTDALPGSEFSGRLSKIGLLPDGRNAWLNPDLQLYNCDIELESYEGMRAGMNCEVNVMVTNYASVVSVPLQCVLRVQASPVVFVEKEGKVVKRPVKLGLDNNRMVHVLEGLSPGEQVLLTPPLEEGSRLANGSNGREPRSANNRSDNQKNGNAAGGK